jgi:hypothetical protein
MAETQLEGAIRRSQHHRSEELNRIQVDVKAIVDFSRIMQTRGRQRHEAYCNRGQENTTQQEKPIALRLSAEDVMEGRPLAPTPHVQPLRLLPSNTPSTVGT